MSADFIPVKRTDANATHAQKVLAAVATLRSLENQLQEIISIGFRNFDAPSDFTKFETLFGIPAGKGNTVFDLFNGTLTALHGTNNTGNAVELMSRVG